MNILVINWRDMEHPEAGGAEVHFVEIFSRLVKRGHSVTLLTTRFPNCAERSVYNGIEILRRGNNFLFGMQAAGLVKKLLAQKTFDCIIDDVNKLPFASNKKIPHVACGALFHHLFGRAIYGAAGFFAATYVYIAEKFYARMYGSIECCAVSPSTADELVKQGFDKSKLTVIENGIDLDRYRADDSVAREAHLLLYVGRLKKYKQVDMIFEAMKILNESGHETKLAIIGTGDDLPRLKKRAAELNLTDKIDFAGFVSEETKIKYLRRATLFVNPSEKEGWGITGIEASACGLPVVANDAPGLRDSVVNNETGILYKENDVAALSSSIKKLLNDTQLRERLSRQGREWAQKFSWDASAERMEAWLQKIIAQKK